ncbi:hypothetical protein EJ03DRAFT_376531 [Teratosphaeria nubilosa]|uniref:Uncharacterized protein n=1 Tax=Teratosphaeria nubilosa TaxID=161662 RepID=A0A6G1L2X5_9PEZI|nr:hypothetical protein EJ03DRAFT_376531 [Teratosphaeria nubilosa]
MDGRSCRFISKRNHFRQPRRPIRNAVLPPRCRLYYGRIDICFAHCGPNDCQAGDGCWTRCCRAGEARDCRCGSRCRLLCPRSRGEALGCRCGSGCHLRRPQVGSARDSRAYCVAAWERWHRPGLRANCEAFRENYSVVMDDFFSVVGISATLRPRVGVWRDRIHRYYGRLRYEITTLMCLQTFI